MKTLDKKQNNPNLTIDEFIKDNPSKLLKNEDNLKKAVDFLQSKESAEQVSKEKVDELEDIIKNNKDKLIEHGILNAETLVADYITLVQEKVYVANV